MHAHNQEPLESHWRSWAKSLTWRLVGVVLLGGISYVFTRDWEKTTWITTVFHTVRFVTYYFHERWWERVSWGRVKHPLAHLPVRKDLTSADHEAIQKLLQERQYLTKPDYEI